MTDLKSYFNDIPKRFSVFVKYKNEIKFKTYQNYSIMRYVDTDGSYIEIAPAIAWDKKQIRKCGLWQNDKLVVMDKEKLHILSWFDEYDKYTLAMKDRMDKKIASLVNEYKKILVQLKIDKINKDFDCGSRSC